MENEKSVVLFHGSADEAKNPLARYAESRIVRAMSDRITATDRGAGAKKLNRSEALLVAQAAIATGLSPFQPQPELWFWKDNRGNLTIQRGRDGTIRLASRAARREGTYLLSPRFRDIVDKAECAKWGIPEGAIAIEATVEDKVSSDQWYSRMEQLQKVGFNKDEILDQLGAHPPADQGIGILTAEEIKLLDGGKNKMPHIERARKRAYIEALKKRWGPLINMDELQDGRSANTDDYIIEGEWMETDVEATAETPQQHTSNTRAATDSLYGKKPDKKAVKRSDASYWPMHVLKEIVAAEITDNVMHAAGILSYSTFDKGVGLRPAVTFATAYKAARDQGKDRDEAGALGMKAFLETLKGGAS